jgi:hypothetical protein
MINLKKISIIIALSIASLLLLSIFVLYNFPYDSVIKRIDLYLTDHYAVNLNVQKVKYRYPFKLFFKDVRLVSEDGSFNVHIDSILFRLKLIGSSKSKNAEIAGSGIYVKSNYLDLSKARVTVVSGFKLVPLLKEGDKNAVDFIGLKMQGAEINRLTLAGFEFLSFKIPEADILLRKKNGNFTFERGSIRSDLFTSVISGEMNYETIDGRIIIELSNEFFRQYINIKGLLDSIAAGGKLDISIKGSLKKPQVRLSGTPTG